MRVAPSKVQPFEERRKRGLVRPRTKTRRCVHELKARSLERDAPLQSSKRLVSVGPCDCDQQPRDRLDFLARTAVFDLRRKGAHLLDTVIKAARHRCPAEEVGGPV